MELGFDGVMIIGCRKDSCRYIDGIEKLKKRVGLLKKILGPKLSRRIIVMSLNGVEGQAFAEISNKFYNLLKEEIKSEV
jgi:coenzyme F420-reducing hydrogenase delta subunit